ncbi:Uncharacterized protein FKW44_001583, partial [Caligus rogercresseyi]
MIVANPIISFCFADEAVLITGFSVLFGFCLRISQSPLYSLLLKPTCREIPLPISAPEWFSKLLDLTREKPPVSCRCEAQVPSDPLWNIPACPAVT